ncbi:hypothetical protein CCHL11_00499 [Colletotrichum chlorophyti]|uniref:Uncharacterized protein n=1 Tax=Colletotrichum chlorophyti TaxID=708187 RepID=A0A1Q8RU11_9PEZI|nr:hypothetical protein CCHL11_00499 [Colletotrichum chlorophyti]
MSSPAPVPSKAAIHALRGLLFGTSCSLVLLAEERRQRIKIARSAVENGRKLKSLKRYSTSGTAAVEALQAEVLNDPDFGGWSSRSRSRISSHEHGRLASGSSRLDQNVAHDVDSDIQRPMRAPSERDGPRNSSIHALPLERRGRVASDAAKRCSNDPSWSRFPLSGPAIQHTSSARVVLTSVKGRTSTGPVKENSITAAVAMFSKAHPNILPENGRSQGSTPRLLQHETPEAALGLIRRAYSSVAKSQPLPEWLFNLSSLLSAACQQEGNVFVAGQILEVVAKHGPMSEQSEVAQLLPETIRSLIALESPLDLQGSEVSDRLHLAASLLMTDIEFTPPPGSPLSPSFVRVGKELITSTLGANRPIDVVDVFQRVYALNQDKLGTTVWFILQLREHSQHMLAIDVFLNTFAKFESTASYSKRICADIVGSVVKARGYLSHEVLQMINQLRQRDSWDVPTQWAKHILWTSLKSTRNYTAALTIFNDVKANDFYGVKNTYDIRARMVRMCVEANDTARAQAQLEELCALHPEARNDVEIAGELALQKAKQGDWPGVHADFKAMKTMQSLSTRNRDHFRRVFSKMLELYAKQHTWGEVEALLETYIREGMCLDQHLVRFIADRHAKCRDIKALGQWLKFCQDAGFATDGAFWAAIFASCRKDWKYDNQQMLDLYRNMKIADIDGAFPDMETCVKNLTLTNTHDRSKLIRVTSYMVSPANEATAFARMKAEANSRNWQHVLATYKRAIHNGMGYSDRSLKLAVAACVHFEGPQSRQAMSLLKKAQLEGHDISDAIYPVILAQLNEIQECHREAADSRGRSRPYKQIKGLFDNLRAKNIRIDDHLYNRAARVCLALRNYREMVSVCTIAAQANGHNDLCYSVFNFTNLFTSYVAMHEYERLRWLLAELKNRAYRTSRPCRNTLKWAAMYLKRASQADKAENLRQSDIEMLVLVQEARDALAKENLNGKAELRETILAVVAEGSKPAQANVVSDNFTDEETSNMLSEGDVSEIRPPALARSSRRLRLRRDANTYRSRGTKPQPTGAWTRKSSLVR